MESCDYDVLDITLSDPRNAPLPSSDILRHYCGAINPGVVVLRHQHLYMVFSSDKSVNNNGFNVTIRPHLYDAGM